MTQSAHQDIDTLLDIEYKALLSADFETIFELSEHKETLLNDVIAANTDAKTVTHMLEKLTKNQSLISAALKGVSHAQQRIKDLQQVQSKLSVYDQNGTLSHVSMSKPELEKKA